MLEVTKWSFLGLYFLMEMPTIVRFLPSSLAWVRQG